MLINYVIIHNTKIEKYTIMPVHTHWSFEAADYKWVNDLMQNELTID